MSEASEERQPIVVNLTISGAYLPPQVESVAARPAGPICHCNARAGAGSSEWCLCGATSGAGR
jgi:hypothetical protein